MIGNLGQIVGETARLISQLINGPDSNEIRELIQKANQETIWQADETVKQPTLKEYMQNHETDSTDDPEKTKWEFSSSTDFINKYVCRGLVFADSEALQQSLNATYGNLTFMGFGSVGQESGTTEIDLGVDYTRAFGDVSVSGGYFFYKLIDQSIPDTQEVYLGIGFDTSLNPNFMVVHDFGKGKGQYISGSLSKDFKIGNLTISTSAELGYNNHYFRDKSGFSNLTLGAGVPIDLGKGWTMTPSVNYNEALSDDLESRVWGGLSFSWSGSN